MQQPSDPLKQIAQSARDDEPPFICSRCGKRTWQGPGIDPFDDHLIYLSCCVRCVEQGLWNPLPMSKDIDMETWAMAVANKQVGGPGYQCVAAESSYRMICLEHGWAPHSEHLS